jgi:hypothetical protein
VRAIGTKSEGEGLGTGGRQSQIDTAQSETRENPTQREVRADGMTWEAVRHR